MPLESSSPLYVVPSPLFALVPRLCLGTHCIAGSAGGFRGGASKTVRFRAEPGNEIMQSRRAQLG